LNRGKREKDFFSFSFLFSLQVVTRGLTTPFQGPSPSSEARRKEEAAAMHPGFRKEPLPGTLLWRRTTLKRPRNFFSHFYGLQPRQRHPSGLRRPYTSSKEFRQAGTAPTLSARNLTTGRVSVNVNCKPPHAGQELPGCVSVNANCKPPHAGQELTGRVSVNANCKPPHAGQELPGRVSVNSNCKPPHGLSAMSGLSGN
jgi:hypothetical protein